LAQYELMSIIRPDLDEEHLEATVESLSSTVSHAGGTVEKVDKWGRRHLAYPVQGHPDGYYVVVAFSGQGAISNEVMRVLNLSESIMRSIVVRTDPD
jgi:small subunit ribosomal protein S6